MVAFVTDVEILNVTSKQRKKADSQGNFITDHHVYLKTSDGEFRVALKNPSLDIPAGWIGNAYIQLKTFTKKVILPDGREIFITEPTWDYITKFDKIRPAEAAPDFTVVINKPVPAVAPVICTGAFAKFKA